MASLKSFASFVSKFLFGASSHLLFVSIKDSISADRGGNTVGQELDKEVDEDNREANTEGDHPLQPVETIRADFEHNISELGNENLKAEDADPDNQEDGVGENAGEGVHFVMDLARAEHVNYLEHDEGGEEESEVAGRASGLVALFCCITNRFP